MKTASYMMDVLGPRLSGSPGIRQSGEWVVSKMQEWGLTGATLEPWPTDPTGLYELACYLTQRQPTLLQTDSNAVTESSD